MIPFTHYFLNSSCTLHYAIEETARLKVCACVCTTEYTHWIIKYVARPESSSQRWPALEIQLKIGNDLIPVDANWQGESVETNRSLRWTVQFHEVLLLEYGEGVNKFLKALIYHLATLRMHWTQKSIKRIIPELDMLPIMAMHHLGRTLNFSKQSFSRCRNSELLFRCSGHGISNVFPLFKARNRLLPSYTEWL